MTAKSVMAAHSVPSWHFAQRLELLRSANLALAQSLDLDIVLETLLEYLQQLIAFDYAGLLLAETNGVVVVRAAKGRLLTALPGLQPGSSIDPATLPFLDILRRTLRSRLGHSLGMTPQDGYAEKSLESWIGIPLLVAGEWIGFCLVGKEEREFYTDDDVRMLESLLFQVGVTIANARMYDELRQRVRELEAVQEVSQALRHAANIETLAPILVGEISRLLDGRQTTLALLEADERTLVVSAAHPTHQEAVGKRRVVDAPVLNRLQQGVHWEHTNGLTDIMTRVLWTPLVFENRVLGLIELELENHKPLKTVETRLLQTLTEMGAVALTRLQLRETLEQEVEKRTHELRRRQMVAEGLRYILTILNSNRPLQEVLEYIACQACWLLDTTTGVFYRWWEDEDALELQAACGLPMASGHELHVPCAESVESQVLRQRQPLVLYGPGEAQTKSALNSLPLSFPMRCQALLAVPLVVEQQTHGVLALYFPEPRVLGDEDVVLVEMFADQAALAIANAELRLRAEQTAVAAERNRLARELHDAVTQTLFSAGMIADVLPDIWQRDPVEGRRLLDELRNLTRGALAELRALLFELRPRGLTEVSLPILLEQLAQAMSNRARIPIRVVVEGTCSLPPEVQVGLYRIAQEALNNIVKHAGATQAIIRLRCEWQENGQRLEMTIEDDGCGFDTTAISPHSLGLTIMRERAETIKAVLSIHSQPRTPNHRGGTRVHVSWSG
ncbi:MAG: GAF domain-containing protein [Caldilineales bacterium]|nr:GAF domain-containing protein [Caldilineales bacterium]